MNTVAQVFLYLGLFVRALGFLLLGYGAARFTLDAYYKGVWQTQVALALGFFFLLVGLTKHSSPASMGLFAFGAGAALVMQFMGKKEEKKKEE
ncbi:MAG: hypothetical protein LC099_02605 [Anaerolineales bacterium]|nr:hypothetical protein [Anaerolineales bacterium]